MHYKTTTINLGGRVTYFYWEEIMLGQGALERRGAGGGGRPQHANIATYRLNRPRS